MGQAGWKTVGQEYLPPAQLHRWVIGAYASFLFTVSERTDTLSLGVHPFAQTRDADGALGVTPWLHPVFFLDIGAPTQTEELIESYRVDGHSTYLRKFENGLVLYNPDERDDAQVSLGGEYIDPWDTTCTPRTTFDVAAQSGALLMRLPPPIIGGDRSLHRSLRRRLSEWRRRRRR